MLVIDTDNRPDIDYILNKHFLLKYIKLNLIKQISNNSKGLGLELHKNKECESKDKVSVNNSTDTDSESKLNLKFNSIPNSNNSDSQKNTSELKELNSITIVEDVSIYKIHSDSSKNNSDMAIETIVDVDNEASNRVRENDIDNKLEERNSVFTKVEKLKKFLENFLGLEAFLDLYFKINDYYLNITHKEFN